MLTSKQKLVSLLAEEDVESHEDLYLLKEACGFETVKKILLAFSDRTEYIKKPSLLRFDSLFLRYIAENKHKTNKQLAKELNVSPSHIYKLRTNYKD